MSMFQGVVRGGSVLLPPDVDLPDGTVVRVETVSHRTFAGLEDLKGRWNGDDAESVVDEIYRRRSSASQRAQF